MYFDFKKAFGSLKQSSSKHYEGHKIPGKLVRLIEMMMKNFEATENFEINPDIRWKIDLFT